MVQNKKKSTIYYLEFVRAISALAVVLLHLASSNWYGNIGSFNWIIFTIIKVLTIFSVPCFFMLSGALFLQKDKTISVNMIYTRYILRLIIFLLFWGFIYQIYSLVSNNIENNSFITILKISIIEVIKGNTTSHLWFVYAIIGIYMFLPLFKTFTDYAKPTTVLYVILLLFLISSIIPLFKDSQSELALIITKNYNNMYIQGISAYAGYFLLGHYLHIASPSKKIKYLIYALGAISVIFALSATLIVCISTDTLTEKYIFYTMPNVAFYSSAIFLLIKTQLHNTPNIKFITCVSDASLGIYGVHLLIIFLLQHLRISTLSTPALLTIPILFIVVVSLSILITYLLKKIPILGKYIS